jgi:hypothetical protein
VLDRASTFADPEIVSLLKSQFIPVAIDQAYQRRQDDTEGDFYRKIAGQGPRSDFSNTTQGLYIADAAGTLIAYNNNRGAERIRRLMQDAVDNFQPPDAQPLTAEQIDERYRVRLEDGGAVVRVHAQVLGGYERPKDHWDQIFQTAVSRDNLWITVREQSELAAGRFPKSLALRIARFHLIDNTRGEPPMWEGGEVRSLEMSLVDGEIRGHVELRTDSGLRGFRAELRGVVTCADDKLTQFDCVAKGDYWGHGRYTPGAPSGKFPLVISFRLADGSDLADGIPPQGSRFWIDGYLRPE